MLKLYRAALGVFVLFQNLNLSQTFINTIDTNYRKKMKRICRSTFLASLLLVLTDGKLLFSATFWSKLSSFLDYSNSLYPGLFPPLQSSIFSLYNRLIILYKCWSDHVTLLHMLLWINTKPLSELKLKYIQWLKVNIQYASFP